MSLAHTVLKQVYRRYTRRGEEARQQLGYFPKLNGGNPEGSEARKAHPRAWTWPAYLNNPSCPWLEVLRHLYAQPYAFPASISPEAGLLLHALVRNVRPRAVVETGSFIGISTIWIAAALRENGDGGVLHAFDKFDEMQQGPWRREVLEENRLGFVVKQLERAELGPVVVASEADSGDEAAGGSTRSSAESGRPIVHLHVGDSAEGIERLVASGQLNRGRGGPEGVQFAFLDGDHSLRGVVRDFEAVEPLIPTGGYLLLHDVYPEFAGSYKGPRYVVDHARTIGRGRYERCELYLAPVNYGMALLRRVK